MVIIQVIVSVSRNLLKGLQDMNLQLGCLYIPVIVDPRLVLNIMLYSSLLYKEITYIILGGREGVFPQHFLQKVEYRKKQIIPSRKWYY
jgi:hypothetical protein